MKRGAGGSPFDDDDDVEDDETPLSEGGTDADTTSVEVEDESTNEMTEDDEGSSQSFDDLPYIFKRNKVNEGREQVPFFIRDDVMDDEKQLIDQMENRFERSVPKSDIREAALIVAQRHPELVADVFKEWGYGLE